MSQPKVDHSASPPKPKSGCGSTILKGLLVLIVVAAAAGVFIWQQNQAIKRAALEETFLKDLEPPKNLALQAVQSHEGVKGEIGEPIESKQGLRRIGSGELDRSNAAFSFDISGSKGPAVVDAVAKQADGNWQISQITVKLPSGKTVEVPPPSADAPPELDFTP
jgi:hypothetical protein